MPRKLLPKSSAEVNTRVRQLHNKELSTHWDQEVEASSCRGRISAAIITLPRVRPLTLRESFEKVALYKNQNHEAALGQTRGSLAPKACVHCSLSYGPFAECVVLADRFRGACCNCHYNGQDGRCSFRHEAVEDQPAQNVTLASAHDHTKTSEQQMARPEPTPKVTNPMSIQHIIDQSSGANPKISSSQSCIDLTGDSNEEPGSKRQRMDVPALHNRTQAESRLSFPVNDPVSQIPSNGLPPVKEMPLYSMVDHQRVIQQNLQFAAHNRALVIESQRLRRENLQLISLMTKENLEKLSAIKNIVVSNAIIEAAIDAREAEMRVGLSNLRGSEAEIQEGAMQLLQFSNNTSFLISRLVVGAMQDHQRLISDKDHIFMQKAFDNAEPNAEVAAIMAEKLEFVGKEGRDGGLEQGEDGVGNREGNEEGREEEREEWKKKGREEGVDEDKEKGREGSKEDGKGDSREEVRAGQVAQELTPPEN